MSRKKKEGGDVIDNINNSAGDIDPLFPNGLMGDIIINTDDDDEEDEEINDDDNLENSDNNDSDDNSNDSVDSKHDNNDNNNSTDSNGDENSPIKALSEYLRDKGIVDYNDDEFKDDESFIDEIVINRIENGIEEYKKELPETIKKLIDNYEDGVPLSELLGVKLNSENYLKITSEDLSDNETKQKAVVREYYKRLGWKEEKINSKIEKLEARADLEDTSIEILEELQEIMKEEEENYIRNQKEIEKNKAAEYENYKKKFKEDLSNRQEIFKDLKLSGKQKDALYNGIFTFDKDGKNELMRKIEKDPEYNLKVAYMALVLDWDLSSIEKIANTKAAKGLRAAIESGKDRLSGSSAVNTNKSNGKIDFGVISNISQKR